MSFWKRPDIVKKIQNQIDFDEIDAIRIERKGWLTSKHWSKKLQLFEKLPELESTAAEIDEFNQFTDWVTVGNPELLKPSSNHQAIEKLAEELMPWRKGPFRLCGLEIDAEWRSNLKWNRIQPALGSLTDAKVLDVGCGNGYYMFRAATQDPEMILGLDPSVPFLMQFELIQKYARRPELQYELLGAEHLSFFHELFDVVLCMGILYHQRNPLAIMREIHDALVPGGITLIESQVIPGEESIALFPEDRYAKARNVFFVPTTSCLENWIRRSGFESVELVSVERTTTDEQRKTRWTTFESLEDFLDTNDSELTVEGHPAPLRAAFRAQKKQ